MRRVLIVCSFLAAMALTAGPALAAPSTENDKCVKQKDGTMRCTYGGEDVWGVVIGPKGRFIGGERPIIFKSLIDYRVDFLPEMDRTVEAL